MIPLDRYDTIAPMDVSRSYGRQYRSWPFGPKLNPNHKLVLGLFTGDWARPSPLQAKHHACLDPSAEQLALI